MFTAYLISPKSRKLILAKYPPKFPDIFAHHVTVKFGVTAAEKIPSQAKIEVIGYICDDSLEALVVTVNGKKFRADGKRYHITLSLDKAKGRSPVQSNSLILLQPFKEVSPFEIETTPEILK